MAWTNGPLKVFHGTDDQSSISIRKMGIDPRRFRSKADFGAGFYVTTVRHQAEQWANMRCRRLPVGHRATILEYAIDRDELERLTHLCFTLDDPSYYDFVAYCRAGQSNHGPAPRSNPYAIVYGPVSLWPQRLTIADCDQLLFSDPASIVGFAAPLAVHGPPRGKAFF